MTNPKQIQNTQIQNPKLYDLEDRTLEYALSIRRFCKLLPQTIQHQEDIRQLVRSSGSVGANYREANEAISKKDFLHRVRIARKEAKESEYWISLLDVSNQTELQRTKLALMQESKEIMKILGAILRNSTTSNCV
jgi:four helix bundle protein